MESESTSINAETSSTNAASTSGISFSIPKRSQSSVTGFKGKLDSRRRGGERRDDEDRDKDLVFSLEDGNIHSSKPVVKKEYVVPLIRKVVWRGVEGDNGKREGEKEEDGGLSGEELVKSKLELERDKEAAEAIVAELENLKSQSGGDLEKGPVIPLLMQNKPPIDDTTDVLSDVAMRPESSTAEEYEEMPIGEFGKAMLAGMGWQAGKAIGKTNKGMVAPVEFIPRMGKLGLGAAPKPQAMPVKKGPRRPGESEKKVQGPYIGADGRVKHTRLIGEEIPEQPIEGFRPGNFVRVLSGPHLGLCGKIVSADEDNSRVTLKMAINGQVMDFSQHHLELISKDEYKKPPSKPKEYGLITKRDTSVPSSSSSQWSYSDEGHSSKTLVQTSSDDRKSLNRGSRERKRHTEHTNKSAKRRRHDRENHSSRKSDSHLSKSSSSHSEDASHHDRAIERLWVAPNLRVRIVDRKFKKGKYYNTKVEILDVVSGDQCVCQTAEGRHLEDVHQGMLETVVPKTVNAAVMIVGGKKHKGQVGRVLERDSKKCKATVEVVYNRQVLTVDYDNICEYIGDIDDL